jgi:dual specificity tyrosine-phosphorylation-regulated kinase 2/3/4
MKSGKNESNLIDLLTDVDDNGCILQKFTSFDFRGHFVMVFELFSLNLYQFLEREGFQGLALSVIKRIAVQVLITLKTIHSLNYIHCDLKPENLMFKYESKSLLKVIDYGSASCSTDELLDYIQSRYYRAPEVVLGCSYTEKIDIWSFGCILVECFTGEPLFPAESEKDLLIQIQETIGKPCKTLLSCSKFSGIYINRAGFVISQVNYGRKTLNEVLLNADPRFVDLVQSCLKWNPEERISAESALNHPWMRR